MTTKTKVIEVWVAMNEDGEYAVRDEKDDVLEALYDDFGYEMCRLAKFKVTMNPPVLVEGGEVVIADEASETIMTTVSVPNT